MTIPLIFSPKRIDLFDPFLHHDHDTYMLLADYESCINYQEEVGKLYKDKDEWAKKSILNVVNMGKFSSDPTIREYARDIWGIEV